MTTISILGIDNAWNTFQLYRVDYAKFSPNPEVRSGKPLTLLQFTATMLGITLPRVSA